MNPANLTCLCIRTSLTGTLHHDPAVTSFCLTWEMVFVSLQAALPISHAQRITTNTELQVKATQFRHRDHRKGKTQVTGWHKATCPTLVGWRGCRRGCYLSAFPFGGGLFLLVSSSMAVPQTRHGSSHEHRASPLRGTQTFTGPVPWLGLVKLLMRDDNSLRKTRRAGRYQQEVQATWQ